MGLLNVNQRLGGLEQASFGNLAVSGANLVATATHAAISGQGLANINGRLGGIENQLGGIAQT